MIYERPITATVLLDHCMEMAIVFDNFVLFDKYVEARKDSITRLLDPPTGGPSDPIVIEEVEGGEVLDEEDRFLYSLQ